MIHRFFFLGELEVVKGRTALARIMWHEGTLYFGLMQILQNAPDFGLCHSSGSACCTFLSTLADGSVQLKTSDEACGSEYIDLLKQ